jgi:hypothetical protein
MGNLFFDPGQAFTCQDGGTVIIPLTEAGAIYLLIFSCLILSFSVMVLLVFYRIPHHYRLVAIPGNQISRILSLNNTSINLDELDGNVGS